MAGARCIRSGVRRGGLGRALVGVAFLVVGGCADNPVIVQGDDFKPPPVPPPEDPVTARCTQEFGDPAASPHTLPWPAGKSYRLFQGYCPSNRTWGHWGWLAYDFDVQIGDTVLASRGGRVFAARDSFEDATRVCGEENWVFIEHDDGTVMQYAHLTKGGALVSFGETVSQGQPIGLSGDSGCSSGPHLHVALFRNRNGFDADDTLPLNYVDVASPLDARNGLVQGQTYPSNVP